ncbi:PLP-dependent aminotransferase family protein [Marinomonas spartinae]|uniref:aminotransferase-like domain-containing protein n=1 Tax=Marinomonas spartinae TaxID=1792290 RepID=UPI0018F25C23|nr:PLP-dependent aminotransferase family protein [Marinomonas spartinae]MBJ7554985.1 PLP-dependent aminotransferase family protein [Marinomonas spartinae]
MTKVTMFVPDIVGRVGPKYKVLADVFEEAVIRGELKTNTKLPSQRILSYQLGVTVGTITRAYQELERRGVTVPVVGSGTYVKDKVKTQEEYYHPIASRGGMDLCLCRPLILGQQKRLSESLEALVSEPNAQRAVLDYFISDGLQGHSTTLQTWLNERWQWDLDASRLLWTYGGQHALSVVLQALTRSGDSILLEGLCYGELINTCAQQERKAVPVAMDEEGLIPDDLALQCQRHRPRLLYLTPSIQNPTGVRLSDSRRLKIIEICRRFDVLIIEDDVMYCQPDERCSPLVSIAPDITLYIGSFSKYFAGGVRVGYMVLPSTLQPAMKQALRTSCMHVSPLLLDLVCRWLSNGAMEQVEEEIARELKARYRIFYKMFPTHKKLAVSGFNVWLYLPENCDSRTFKNELAETGVFVRDAYFFRVGSYPVPNAIRLSLTGPVSRDELKTGLQFIKDKIAAWRRS